MAEWSNLPEELLGLIAKRLKVVLDKVGFSAVCRSWRSVATSGYNVLLPQPPWLMLPEKDGPRCFAGLAGPKVYELELPELHQKRCIGSTGTWLITVDKNLMIHLFNPLSRVQIELPPQSTFQEQVPNIELWTAERLRNAFVNKAVLSSSPSLNSDFIVIAIFNATRKLAFARLGDKLWTTIESPFRVFDDVIFYKGQFYAVNNEGKVVICDVGPHPNITQVLKCPVRKRYIFKYYLVEWSGELLMVLKYLRYDRHPFYTTIRFEVYKVNFTNGKWDEVKNLEQHSLFLGFNSSVSLLASNSTVFRRNCIYFTDDNIDAYVGRNIEGGRDMGVFDLEDGSIQPHYTGINSLCYFSPPIWIIPRSKLCNQGGGEPTSLSFLI